MDASELKALQETITKLKEDPTLIYEPQVLFFKDFISSWGAKMPTAQKKPEPQPTPAAEPAAEEEEEEEPEEPEEPEGEDPERLPEDPEPYPEKGPAGEIEFTDEQMDKMGEIKQQAAEALEDGDLKQALEKYTAVVKMGNTTAMVYAKRAEILLKLKRPNACIADCDAAVAINPDSGKAYRLRGKAHRRLGHWGEAHKDLSTAQQLDFDDDTVDVQKLVAEKFKKISERQNRIRLREERIAKKKKDADIKARKEAAKKAYEEAKAAEAADGGMPGGFPGMPGGFPGMPGGMGGMPGMPAGLDPAMMQGLLSDPDLMAALQNPKMAGAMQDIMSNPGNISKYASDPEVMGLVQKLMGKMGGAGGFDPSAMFGGMDGGAPAGPDEGASTSEMPASSASVEEID